MEKRIIAALALVLTFLFSSPVYALDGSCNYTPGSTTTNTGFANCALEITEAQNRGVIIATTTNSGNDITATSVNSPAISTLRNGTTLVIDSPLTISGAARINLDGTGLKNVLLASGASTASGDMVSATRYALTYKLSNTSWYMVGPGASGSVSANSTTEVLTGTDTTKFTTADSLAALWEANTTDITDGATITIGEGHYFNLITSTTAITAFTITTDRAGREFWVKFNTSRTLTNNAAIEIVEGGISQDMVSGNYALIQSKGSGNVRVLKIIKADGTAVVGGKTAIKKSANQSVASATLANDTDFTFALAANTNYYVRIVAKINHSSTNDFQFDVTGPASPDAVSIFGQGYLDVAAGGLVIAGSAAAFSSAISLLSGTSLFQDLIVDIYINNGANAGTFQFRWANVSGATSHTMDARSFMTYEVVN
jgi:hypothetical protein